ncbi:protein translocase subunit SecF [Trueperella sp. LYQ143]|uniref:protein translocase subunit SecF n=1 Tax=unclassified Trueperella TaxID=2630174 RepID=UPI0039831818
MSVYSIGNDLYSGRKSYDIIGKRKIWFAVAFLLVAISLLSFVVREPNLGIEFRGGSQFTVSGTQITDHKPAYDVVAKSTDAVPRVSTVGTTGVRVQTEQLDDQKTQEVKAGLAQAYQVPDTEVTSTYIGPSWGQDIMSQAVRAMIIFMVLISVVLMIYFRSWTIAIGAIGALLHDFIVTLGVYWILGMEIAPATVIGLLTIMGYSLYDTVVVFDKVRENTASLTQQREMTYGEKANLAINQTLIRSLNTSITGLLPVMAVLIIGVWLLGAQTLRDLGLVMFVGMLLSAISSIFVAAPLAVALAERNPKIKQHRAEVLEIRQQLSSSETSTKAEETSGKIATVRVSGGHQGQAAQPKRRKKKRNKR